MKETMQQLHDKIEKEYNDLGYQNKWALVFSDYETFCNPRYSLTFFGLNPGGEEGADYNSAVATDGPVKLDNAYLDQGWAKDGKEI